VSLFSKFTALFTRDNNDGSARAAIDWDDLERTLIAADLGPIIAQQIASRLRENKQLSLQQALAELLSHESRELHRASDGPTVIMVVGVNGTGKTTTVGKLGARLVAAGGAVIMVAADTFRAAAREQLQTWSERVGARCVSGSDGADPAAVAFDGVTQGIQERADYVLIDTAGRLHTKEGLMDQLGKIRRVIEKRAPVHEVLLVLDGSTGQNALAQAENFTAAVAVTGLVLTKLDGSARAGSALAIESALGIPIKFVGSGEGVGDLAPFDPDRYIEGLIK
jgi:fused signal recognition particle receptor